MNIIFKTLLSILALLIYSCIQVYEIEEYQKIVYEPLENLGFEDGLNHWNGKTSIYSQISIDTISVEGNNSLKLSSSLSAVEDSLLSDTSIASISKSLSVKPGDTLIINFKYLLKDQFIDAIKVYSYLSFPSAEEKPKEIYEGFLTLVPNNWENILLEYPIPEGINHIVYSVDFISPNNMGTEVYINLDDFDFDFSMLINNEPSEFQLTNPSNESQILDSSHIQFNWNQATDLDNDTINYEFKIWTESVINNYLVNPSLDSVTTHWLGTDIPKEWDFWPYYFHNVFTYPQLPDDSIVNDNLIQDGEYSMRITGDFTGQENNTILYQGFTPDYIPAGTRVTFSGYMLNPSLDPIKNDNHGFLSIDQFGTGSSLIINHTSESITKNHSLDQWHYFETSSVTQNNTRSLQIRINYVQFDDDSGSVFVDNLSITTSNSRLIIYEKEDVEENFISVNRDILTDPYDFSERDNLIFFWNVTAKDMFDKTLSENGPFKIILN